MRKFAELENSGNIGFCAPFRAQVKLMKKYLRMKIIKKISIEQYIHFWVMKTYNYF